jgi:hypothetical protein
VAAAFLLLLTVATPLSILAFLTAFLVNMLKGRRESRFTQLCERAQLPAFGAVALCLFLTLRYF